MAETKPHTFVAPPSYRMAKIRRVQPTTRCERCGISQAEHYKVAPLMDDDCGGQHG